MFKEKISYYNFALFTIFSACDKLITYYALKNGLQEFNGLILLMINQMGTLTGLLLAYIIPLIIIYLMIRFNEEKHLSTVKFAMVIINILYIIVVCWNLILLYDLFKYGLGLG